MHAPELGEVALSVPVSSSFKKIRENQFPLVVFGLVSRHLNLQAMCSKAH